MKRIISTFLLVFMLSTVFMVNAAAETTKLTGFYNIETVNNVTITPYIGETPVTATSKDVDGDSVADTWYEGSERLAVSYTAATVGAYYGVIMVDGTGLPTEDNTIFYIDQVSATTSTISFNVYPTLPTETTEMTLYISSNAEGFDLIPVSLNYVCAEETVAPPATEGQTVSGTITSYLVADGTVTVELVSGGTAVYSATGTTSYSIENVAAGTYTLKVSKADHITLEEEITVEAAAVTKNVKIYPKGDVNNNGNITTIDFSMANSHAKEVSALSGYKFKCADVVGTDGRVTTADAMRINSHAKEVSPLW